MGFYDCLIAVIAKSAKVDEFITNKVITGFKILVIVRVLVEQHDLTVAGYPQLAA